MLCGHCQPGSGAELRARGRDELHAQLRQRVPPHVPTPHHAHAQGQVRHRRQGSIPGLSRLLYLWPSRSLASARSLSLEHQLLFPSIHFPSSTPAIFGPRSPELPRLLLLPVQAEKAAPDGRSEWVIPKGDIVFTSPAVAGRLESVWTSPNAFDPDRFIKIEDGGREEDKGSFKHLGDTRARIPLKSIHTHTQKTREL